MTIVTNSSLRGVSGIYAIRCVNGKVYVGSATNLGHRWAQHKCSLRKQKHSNPLLQRTWNKYGEDSLTFEVLEFVPEKLDLISREQYWMDTLQSCDRERGFNLNIKAANRLGMKHSQQTKDLISAVQIGKKPSLEAIEKVRQALQGKPKQGRNGKGINNFRSVEFSFVSPEGVVYKGRNVSLFAAQHNLRVGALHDMLAGRRNQHRGWRVAGHPVAKGENNKEFAFICPEDGKVYTGRGITAFACQHGLSFSLLCAVHRGDIPQYKGWRKAELKPIQLSLPI